MRPMSFPQRSIRNVACLLLVSALAGMSDARAQSAPRLALVEPMPNAILASPASSLRLVATEDLDPQSIDGSIRVWGRWSGAVRGWVSLEDPRIVRFDPARAFLPGEAVTLMVSSALRSQGGMALTGGYTASFTVAAARSSGRFTQVNTIALRNPGESLLQTYGVYAGDVDGDGAPDLSAVNEQADDVRLYLNDGCGSYTASSRHRLTSGARPSTNEGSDFNGDGVTDLAVGNILTNSVSVLFGDGSGSYLPEMILPTGTGPRGLAVLDVEGDGDVDIVTANRFSSNLALHRNRGDGTFDPAAFFDGGGAGETALAAGDANGDGYADLWVGNFNSSTVSLLLNDGRGVFTPISWANVGTRPWMIALADLDGDGDLDVATCDSSVNQASIVRNDGRGSLGGVTSLPSGVFPIAVDLGDLDGDGDVDVVISNYASGTYTIYRNTGNGSFGSRQDLRASRAGSCVVIVDDDRDGDVDLIGIDEVDDLLIFYRQEDLPAAGAQPRSCEATLRIDGNAQRNGFGALAPLELPMAHPHFLALNGIPNQPYLIATGFPALQPLSTDFGLFHLDPPTSLVTITGVLDRFGESRTRLLVPPVPGRTAPFGLQALVLGSTAPVFSNAELLVVGF